MRTRQWLTAAACTFLAPFAGVAQCSNTIVTVTHETTISATGSMGSPSNFSFPLFDGELGTLMEVRFIAVSTVSYSVNVENNNANPQTALVGISRYDQVTSALLAQPVVSNYLSPQQFFNLGPSDGVPGSGPDYEERPPIYILNHDTVVNEIVNAANFIGAGTVSFDYISLVGYTVIGNNVAVSTQVQSEMTFIVQYTYCSPIVLAPDVSNFTAIKKGGDINLRWFTPSEQDERKYIIEKSSDGQVFSAIGAQTASPQPGGGGDYQFSYTPHPGESGKLMFRILVKNGNTGHYTTVRVVDLYPESPSGRIRLAPNPSANGSLTLFFPPHATGPWEVTLFSPGGQLISRKTLRGSGSATFQADRPLSPGVYVISVVNTMTRERFAERLMIR